MSTSVIDFSKYEATPQIDFSKYESSGAKADAIPGFWDTLEREGKALGGTIAGIPSAVYHAFSEPATKEEAEKFGGEDQVSGAKRIGLGLHRLTTAPVEVAAKFYSDAAKGKYGDASAVESALLNDAPEGIGSAAGSVAAGKLMSEVPGAANTVIEKTPAVVRGTVKGVNTALAKAPGTVGATVGAAAGHATGLPYASEVGAGLGAIVGKELLPQVKIPGEGFGLPNRVTGGPSNAPQFQPTPEPTPVYPGASNPENPSPALLQANALMKGGAAPPPEPSAALGNLPVHAVQQAIQELGPKATIVALTERANNIAKLGDLLNEGLGGKGLEPNVPLKNQGGVVTPRTQSVEPQASHVSPFPESKVQQVVYHGTDAPFDKVDMSKGAQNGFWVSSDRAKIASGESGATSNKHIMEMHVNLKNPAGWEEYESQMLDQIAQKHDGIILRDSDNPDSFDALIFKPEQVALRKSSIPEGHTPVQSSALKSYKYDPETREFESVTNTGAHYIHGDVSPEQAEAFEAADSKGKAWNELRKNSTLVAKVVNGKRVPIMKTMSDADQIPDDEWQAGHELETAVEGSRR